MRIQIIEADKQHYNATQLCPFKKTCDVWLNEYGSEKLDWLHAETIDFSCDFFFNPINHNQVQIGFVLDDSNNLNTKHQIHWVTITALDTTAIDGLTQVLLVTIGIGCIRSVTGSFSTDWTDIKAALCLGSNAYCTVLDWDRSQQTIERLSANIGQLKTSAKVVSCAMLLNQSARLNQVFENIQSLMSTDIISSECLTITNITHSEQIPQKNVVMFVCNSLTNSTK